MMLSKVFFSQLEIYIATLLHIGRVHLAFKAKLSPCILINVLFLNDLLFQWLKLQQA